MDLLEVGPVLDGEQLSEAAGGFHQVVNPATGEVIAREACCGSADVDRIAASASRAFESPEWQKLAPADRGNMLLKLAGLVEREAERLAGLELLDTGKPAAQLRTGELPLTAAIIRFYAGAADKIEGAVKTTSGGSFQLTMYEPYGVVAGILPWNYPLVNVALKVAPALAAGNAIVLKPSVETPLSCTAFAGLCTEAGFPPGIVNVVLGSGSVAGVCLVDHPEVRKISFTGSTAVGQAIQKLAADRMKKVNLELGGKNAIIVFSDADLERAAEAVLFSAFVNAGQLCVSCSRLLVEEAVAGEFESLLVEKLSRVKAGDPRAEDTLVGPMITRSQYEVALGYLAGARAEGCKVLSGGGRLDLPAPFDKGFWVEPTLLSGARPGMKVADEEIFGPVLSSIRFQGEDEAVKISNGVIYGLSGSVWTGDSARALRMVKALDTGLIWVNSMFVGYPQIPLPPHKMSGTGVELGFEGLLAYCKRKSTVIGYDETAPVGWNLG
ncbi:MAG: aldehyde dehydrogenase [Candidatus Glassbacteria bacterium]|nr:aldehyde dehydrogenase [Candidatus Glassbacteria bacterium]